VRLRLRSRPAAVAVAVVSALLFAACSVDGSASPSAARSRRASTTTTTSPGSTTTTTVAPPADVVPERIVAGAKIPLVAVFDAPGGTRPPARTLRNPTWEGYRLSFLVEESRPDGWLKVNVPVRPNGTVGWIQSTDVELAAIRARIEISLSAHRLRYWNGSEKLLDEPVALGTARTPTPPGSFFVDIVARPPNPRGAFGPYQVSITAFSDILERFGGGIGQLAIHGTNRPQLIGQNVSNGCIRMSNAAITILAEHIAIGTPVDIVA
jgi:lipoprotein-anchoring transpeptidase ErfK/SrfK